MSRYDSINFIKIFVFKRIWRVEKSLAVLDRCVLLLMTMSVLIA